MNNRIFYHALSNSSPVELAHFYNRGVVHLYHDEGISIIIVEGNTYRIIGNKLPSIFKIYHDANLKCYYIIKDIPPYAGYCSYLQLYIDSQSPASGGLISGKGQAIDTTGLVLCTQTNTTQPPVQTTNTDYIDANTTYTYVSKSKNGTYAAHASLILVNGRDTNGIWFCGLYLIYKHNAGTSSENYNIETLFATSNANQFYVTPISNGLTFKHAVRARYNIVEMTTEAIE